MNIPDNGQWRCMAPQYNCPYAAGNYKFKVFPAVGFDLLCASSHGLGRLREREIRTRGGALKLVNLLKF